MKLVNIKHPDERVSFREAVIRGLGRGQGLYFFETIAELPDSSSVLGMEPLERNLAVLGHLVGDEIEAARLRQIVTSSLDFPVPVVAISETIRALELFHGPSLAFKDFGARFMAACLAEFRAEKDGAAPMTILTATSGDTGAAVAHAYHGQPGIRAVILYPKGRISPLQEKLFCTLGDNVTTFAVEDDFDCCQSLVKQAFDDEDLRRGLGLNSANSINIARLIAQVTYYFEAAARIVGELGEQDGLAALHNLVFCVPSGNFGNLTAGLLARAIGLPYKRAIAATNRNDTVPRFLASGRWDPKPTMSTVTSAMDVSRPNNFPRVEALGDRHGLKLEQILSACAVSDEETFDAIRALFDGGYLADPHSALAWAALEDGLEPGENGVFLCTAHPAKFLEVIRECLGIDVPLPPALAEVRDKEVLSKTIPGNFEAFRTGLLEL
jgi:threonine synthase